MNNEIELKKYQHSPELSIEESDNNLWKYIDKLSPELCSSFYHPSEEANDIITNNVNQILQSCLKEELNRSIEIDLLSLKHLLLSVMKTGYFLKSVENKFQTDFV